MRRLGFTLVEMLVALLLTGIVVLLAHGIFATISDSMRSLRARRVALDRSVNAQRWLAAAFLSLEVGQEGSAPFDGTSDQVQFASRIMTEHGWAERRSVSIVLDGGRLVARAGGDPSLVLADSLVSVAFDYLLEPGADARWMSGWSSPVSAPLAVRLRLARPTRTDTSLFLIGGRG